MKVIETTLSTEHRHGPPSGFLGIIERVLCRLLPMANPDFENSYGQVRMWWVEVDESGVPQRELGFDAQGKVIVAGPLGNNHGFWTDSTMEFDVSGHKAVSEEAFAAAWSQVKTQWEANRLADIPSIQN